MKTYCYTLDLKDDPELIAEYERYHQQVWPEILQSITDSGIQHMTIYRWANRLCMIVHAADDYDPAAKAEKDAADRKVQEWETLMWKYQQALPGVPPGTKWVEMKPIFKH
ncbi:L-rhamnose mutarotase [Phaeodactylibacter xiamenensis]|uniref:L-rhamnose mutarotase n=1 Tax=Phaeodactylibacter xiamenensis TaxID=1524460 RepID=UPI003CCC283B